METLTTAAPTSAAIKWLGGKGVAFARGTFGGGTFALKSSFDGTNFDTLTDAENAAIGITAVGFISFELPACELKADLAGSTGATVSYTILPVPPVK